MANDEKYIGILIKQVRESYGMSIQDFAEKVDISIRYLQKIENEGNIPSYKTLKKIVVALSIDTNYLFYDDYNANDGTLDNLIIKLRKCDAKDINVVTATLNALLKNKE